MKNRRIIYRQFGDPDVLELDVATCPTPKPGHVIVKMAGAGLNPIDFKTRRGLGFVASQIADALPWTPGYDFSGAVVDRAEDVAEWQAGDKVFGMVGFPLAGGAYADYIEVTSDTLVRAPDTLPLEAAGGVPLAALTAWQALFVAGDLQPGSRILIHAAAGGVGHFAVQFAKACDCYVIATASDSNNTFLASLGVDEMIDYHKQNFQAVCHDLDFVLDNIGGDVGKASLHCLKDGGQLVTVPTITAQEIIETAAALPVKVAGLTVTPDREQLSRITTLIDSGQVTVNIHQSYSLENAQDAHILLEKGHTRGKLILIP